MRPFGRRFVYWTVFGYTRQGMASAMPYRAAISRGFSPEGSLLHPAFAARDEAWEKHPGIVYCRSEVCHDKAMPKTSAAKGFTLQVKFYREENGRWLADIPDLPGVTAYGRTKKQALAAAEALALRLIADRLEHGEAVPGELQVSFVAP